MEKKSIVLFDLDGCVADDAWRLDLIPADPTKNEHWMPYHLKCGEDEPLAYGAAVLRAHIEAGDTILFTTARPMSVAKHSSEWIAKHFGINDQDHFAILMRHDDDVRGALPLKAEFAKYAIQHAATNESRIVAAYDDREDIVAMYREHGINANVLNKDGMKVWEGDPPPPVIQHPTRTLEQVLPIGDGAPRRSGADILEEAAATYRTRNAIYGDNAHKVGDVMAVLFPNGISIKTSEDHHLYHLFELIIVKLTRFTNSGLTHEDSIHDLMVYAAMVEHLVQQKQHRIEVL